MSPLFKFSVSAIFGIGPSLLLLAWAKQEDWMQAIGIFVGTSFFFIFPVHLIQSAIAHFLAGADLFYTNLSNAGINAQKANFIQITLYLTISSASSAVMGFIGARADEDSMLWIMAGVLLTPLFTFLVLLSKFNNNAEAVKKEINKKVSSKIKSKILELRYTDRKECPSCSEWVKNNAQFCQNCGLELTDVKRCTQCQAVLPEDADFCERCGHGS